MMKKLTDPYKIALNFIKYRFRSQFEIEQKLRRKKSPETIKKVIEKLKSEKLNVSDGDVSLFELISDDKVKVHS